MSVIDELRGLSARAQNLRDRALSERDTERLLVDPFIDALGYDTGDLSEVETQPRIQVGSTEVKCDYAIKRDGATSILIECKRTGFRLGSPEQLSTYFERERAVWLGVYTNGMEYRFYSGSTVDGLKRMDIEHFLLLDLLNFDDRMAEQVAAFAKDRFDPNEVQALAQNIRDRQSVETALREELRRPSDGLVKLLMDRVGAERDEFDRYKPIIQEVAPQLLASPSPQPQRPVAPAAGAPSGLSGIPASGAIRAGIPIRWINRGEAIGEAILIEHRQGRVWLDDQEFRTPTSACQYLLPDRPANGWAEWEYFDLLEQRRLPIGRLRGLSDEEQMRRAGASIGSVSPPHPRSPRA